MALKLKFAETEFGIGDRIRVYQRIKEGEKTRVAYFDGMVIAIKNRDERKTFTVRKVGEASIGIERIFPLNLPSIEKIEVLKKGLRGSKKAKLYYTRDKSTKEIDKIYSRSNKRELAKISIQKPKAKKVSKVKKSK